MASEKAVEMEFEFTPREWKVLVEVMERHGIDPECPCCFQLLLDELRDQYIPMLISGALTGDSAASSAR